MSTSREQKIIDMKKIFDERGFIFVQVIFLTLMVSFAGMMILNGMKKVENHDATLRIIALHLAEEQFAELESLADDGKLSAGSYNFLGVQDDLKNYFNSDEKKINSQIPVNFDVKTQVENFSGNLFKAKIKVEWNFEEKKFVEFQKIIRNAFKKSEE